MQQQSLYHLASYLDEDWKRRHERNRRFSLRAYAKLLKVNPTSLSLYLRRKRSLSKNAYIGLLQRLSEIDSTFPANFYTQFDFPHKKPNSEWTALSIDRLAAVSDWFYFGILSLVECDDFNGELKTIGKRLGLKNDVVTGAVDRLVNLGMLKIDTRGRVSATGLSFSTPSEIPNLAIRQSHFQSLELVKKSLDRDPIQDRSITAITMAIDPERIQEAKKRIDRFSERLCRYLESGKKKRVYRMSLQLFPLSDAQKWTSK